MGACSSSAATCSCLLCCFFSHDAVFIAPSAAVYVGNYEYDASERELERTFEKYGDVDRVEYKSGAQQGGNHHRPQGNARDGPKPTRRPAADGPP